MSGFTVTNCPNIAVVRKYMRSLAKGEHGVCGVRLRGRGVPQDGDWRDYQWATPLKVAPRFTAYYGSAPYTRLEWVAMTKPGGGLRVRYLRDQS